MTYEEKRNNAVSLGNELIRLLEKASMVYDEIEKLDITEAENDAFEKDEELSKVTEKIETLLEKLGWD